MLANKWDEVLFVSLHATECFSFPIWLRSILVNFKLLIHNLCVLLAFELPLVNSAGVNCVILRLQRGRAKTKGGVRERKCRQMIRWYGWKQSCVKKAQQIKSVSSVDGYCDVQLQQFAHRCTVHRQTGPVAEDKDYRGLICCFRQTTGDPMNYSGGLCNGKSSCQASSLVQRLDSL